MHPHEEAAFEAKAEKMLAGHRQAPNGRNVFAFVMRHLNNKLYAENHGDTFNGDGDGSPGSSKWLNNKYCPKCDKKRSWCECQTH